MAGAGPRACTPGRGRGRRGSWGEGRGSGSSRWEPKHGVNIEDTLIS